jgi:deazaflavin-dependent oxidoreductase (nitroreductase family)
LAHERMAAAVRARRVRSRRATPPPFSRPGSAAMNLFNAVTGANVVLYRLSGGRLGSGPVLLLDHTGRKSGRRRTTPVLYIQDGDDLVVVGSRVGSDFDPAWWLNLKANPATTVQVRQRRQVVARQATPEEKERLWPRLVDAYPDYAVYQRRTEREIPVIVLSPA